MLLDRRMHAALALHRFGLGPRAGSLDAISSDPRGAIIAELDHADAARIANADLLTSGEAARVTFDFRQTRKAERLAARAEQTEAAKRPPAQSPDAPSMPNASEMQANAPAATPNRGPGLPQQLYLEEAKARFEAAVGADIGFVERLVWFWSNHFCVSADKGQVRPLAGAFEREAIRAHVLGKFGALLLAVESHPAMLMYLDNARSIGPNSVAGLRRSKGLNENLAREILELHTLGVRSGYSQADVTNFANVITGWTVVPLAQDPARGGEFTFNPRMHEPGPQTVLGRSYSDAGFEQGRAVLIDLARHPATAKHIATKLARHFIADEPPPDLIDHLAKDFQNTDGDLKQVARALVSAPQAWDTSRTKLKRPGEWVVGSMRASGMEVADVRPILQSLLLLGEPLWRPPAPKGFPDDSAAWMDGLAQRLDIANQLSRRLGERIDPANALETALGPLASQDTRQTLARAASRQQALALLLMAPEFQRR
jgi:uncharacterized protein (DUF1800 family)